MVITEGAQSEASWGDLRLPGNACKARYGVAYLRAVCSQAGIAFSETSPDEDHHAVDGALNLGTATVTVQVKCSGQFKISGRSATWPAEVEWRDKWSRSKLPIYFVLVILDVDDQASWLMHADDGTMHRAAAFWVRVDKLPAGSNINVPKGQRLTAGTMTQWAADVDACFAPLGQAS
ncbi:MULTISPECIES: DUF4365 domain-containing protein [unclassified Micromonospora]|uniref:DUF4365 domain-containing protein n=1 Tax=unclassified Micromonospora TaxID=2617518 RepID=UPI002FEE67AD